MFFKRLPAQTIYLVLKKNKLIRVSFEIIKEVEKGLLNWKKS